MNTKTRWDYQDFEAFTAALDEMDFTGLDRDEIAQLSQQNACDVPLNESLQVAIDTARMYIDQRGDM